MSEGGKAVESLMHQDKFSAKASFGPINRSQEIRATSSRNSSKPLLGPKEQSLPKAGCFTQATNDSLHQSSLEAFQPPTHFTSGVSKEMHRTGAQRKPTMTLNAITDQLIKDLRPLHFSEPVFQVYNPLEYARACWDRYVELYGQGTRQVVLVGMNPGPFGMAQTGVPFGEISLVRDWLGIHEQVNKPPTEHPKRPVLGFDCPRSEVSGARLWGWARDRFGTPEKFFERFFVANYCPLVFMEESGANRTPDKLPVAEREALFAACDKALLALIEEMQPELVIGVGQFAENRARTVLGHLDLQIKRILHPSPASPLANRGWAEAAEKQMLEMGLSLA